LEAARVYWRLTQLYYLANETIPMLYASLRGVDLAARAGPCPEVAWAYAALYGFCRFFRLPRLAARYDRQARETAQKLNDLTLRAWALMIAGMWGIGFDPWTKVLDTLEQAIALYKEFGDRRGQGDALTSLGFVPYFQARFATGIDIFADLYALGKGSDNPEHQAFGLNGQAMNVLALGEIDRAATFLEEGWPLLAAVEQSRTAEILNRGLMAVALLRQGRMRAAQQAAETVARLIGSSWPASFGSFHGYVSVAQVYLALCEEALSSGAQAEARALRAAARKACQALHRYAWHYPIGQPRAWLYQGWFERLSGHARRAQRHWRKSLVHAQRLAMPYEEGLAHYEIGRHLRSDDPARQEHLARAAEILARVGARYDLDRVRAELPRP
jgi:hypothetical protein